MQHRDVSLRIKRINEKGQFEGLGAVYGNVDLGGDVIDQGAFSRTLSAGKAWPVLWQHDPSNPIGHAKITDTPQGLEVVGTLMLSDPTAMKAYTFMKAGVVKGLSIGYDTIQENYIGDIRHLTELRLWEISCVTFPMNESAQISGVKAMSDDERAGHIKAINEHRKAIDREQRGMHMHLKSLLDDPDDVNDDDPDDIDEEAAKAILAELQEMTLATK